MKGPLVVVGDVLLDRDLVGRVTRLCPDAPAPVVEQAAAVSRPGGAGLAALLAASDGREVVLVTALADDGPGRELASLLARGGISLVSLELLGATPEKVRVRADGRSLLRLDSGGNESGPIGGWSDAAGRALDHASAVLVADYGRGVTALPDLRRALARLPRRTPVVWDPHPRSPDPPAGITLATPNAAEAAVFAPGVAGDSLFAVTARARLLRERWSAMAVAVTLSERGALLVGGDGTPLVVPAPPVPAADPCGAGDRFASSAAGLLADGALPSEAVVGAVTAAAAFVEAGGAAAVRVDATAGEPVAPPTPAPWPSARDAVARVRSRGGTVVATGGCFDLLHAGHVATLQAARGLGDCLVVCLNSDASVRRLKGPSRPLNSERDRAAVLLALGCVDAVLVFEEDTPETVLEQLRPDIWAKGGDYSIEELPEATLLERWGGQAVVLPYLQGRSTTALVREAARRV